MSDGANLNVARAKADQLPSQLGRGAESEEVSFLKRGGGDKSVGVAKCSAQANGRRPWGTCWPLARRPQGRRRRLRPPSWDCHRLRPLLRASRCRLWEAAWALGLVRVEVRNGPPGLRPPALQGPRTMGPAAACPTRARSRSATGSARSCFLFRWKVSSSQSTKG